MRIGHYCHTQKEQLCAARDNFQKRWQFMLIQKVANIRINVEVKHSYTYHNQPSKQRTWIYVVRANVPTVSFSHNGKMAILPFTNFLQTQQFLPFGGILLQHPCTIRKRKIAPQTLTLLGVYTSNMLTRSKLVFCQQLCQHINSIIINMNPYKI